MSELTAKLTKSTLLNSIYFFGALVPLSYYFSPRIGGKNFDVNRLWGKVEKNIRGIYVTSMILCVISMFFIVAFIDFSINDKTSVLSKPFNKGGNIFYFYAMALFIIPSIIWMPLSIMYLKKPSAMLKYLIIAVLGTVAIGSILLAYAVYNTDTKQNNINHHIWLKQGATVGSMYLAFHLTVLDFYYWSKRFF